MKVQSFLLVFVSAQTTVTSFATCSTRPQKMAHRFDSTCIFSEAAASPPSSSSSGNARNPYFYDESQSDSNINDNNFAIPPEKLLARAREILTPEIGIGTKDGGACLADNFEFCAAVVGPIPKAEYLKALETFNLEDAFDISPNFYGLSVDPMQPNRVWFFNRSRAKHSKGKFMGVPPSGKEIIYPPQVNHLDFNEQGLVTEFGFYTVDRRQGNTGGLGGAFGYMYGVGKPLPIPECRPYKPSLRFRLIQKLGVLARMFQK